LSLALCTTAFAVPNPTGKIDVGIGAAGLFGQDGGTNDTVFIPGAVNYGLNPNWAIGVSGGWADVEINGDNALGSRVDAGSETLIPLFFDILYRNHSEDRSWVPYFDLGLGALFVDHGGNRDLNVNNLSTHDNDGFAVKLAGGVDWFVTENWAYNLELGYILTDASADIVSNVNGSTVDTIDLDFWYVGAGVKYRFD
jgi:outer membrane protein W